MRLEIKVQPSKEDVHKVGAVSRTSLKKLLSFGKRKPQASKAAAGMQSASANSTSTTAATSTGKVPAPPASNPRLWLILKQALRSHVKTGKMTENKCSAPTTAGMFGQPPVCQVAVLAC